MKRMRVTERVMQNFDPDTSIKDLAILFEVTGFLGATPPPQIDPEGIWKDFAEAEIEDYFDS